MRLTEEQQKLVEEHLKLSFKFAWKYIRKISLNDYFVDDMLAASNEILVISALKWEPKRSPFKAFLYRMQLWGLPVQLRILMGHRQHKRSCGKINDSARPEFCELNEASLLDMNFELIADAEEKNKKFKQVMLTLKHEDKENFDMYFQRVGLENTFHSIGLQYAINPQRVKRRCLEIETLIRDRLKM